MYISVTCTRYISSRLSIAIKYCIVLGSLVLFVLWSRLESKETVLYGQTCGPTEISAVADMGKCLPIGTECADH